MSQTPGAAMPQINSHDMDTTPGVAVPQINSHDMDQKPSTVITHGPEEPQSPDDPQGPEDDRAWDTDRFEAVVEAILFASGEPLSLERIAQIVERPISEVKALLDQIEAKRAGAGRGILLRELSGKYQLCTRPELSYYISKLFEIRQKQSLSQAAYEALSIIAYNANVTRAVIEKIRGVNSDSSIAKLLERNLIYETGRASLPGRPVQYDVTDEFYRLFGFKSRMDLPDAEGGATALGEDSEDVEDVE